MDVRGVMGIFGNKKLTQEQVLDALRTVQEPELHRDLVTLKMVKDLAVDDGQVFVTINLTTPACPLKDVIEKDVRGALGKLEGFRDVTIKWDATVPKGRGLEAAPASRASRTSSRWRAAKAAWGRRPWQ